jgi:hypothetical protein
LEEDLIQPTIGSATVTRNAASYVPLSGTLTGVLHQQGQQILQKPSQSVLDQAVAAATAWLTNGQGYKVERRDDNGNAVDTLYMDTPDINTAVNVMRVGQSGIGFSHSGVDGPYLYAFTIDGTFDASLIKVINLVAEKVWSQTGDSTIEISGAVLKMLYQLNETFALRNEANGLPIMYLHDYSDGVNSNNAEFSPHHLKIGGTSVEPVFEINASTGKPLMRLTDGDLMELFWHNNGDGTFSLRGK